jgi:hypothetical protein
LEIRRLALPKISPDRLEAGMKLTKPVLRGDMVLLSEGTVLTDSWVRRIQDMDIDGVHVDGPSQQSVPKEEMLSQLEQRFKNVEGKPCMGLLKKIMKEHIEGLYE